MTPHPESRQEPDVVLRFGPDAPGDPERIVRVSPEYTEELRAYLEAEGLRARQVLAGSSGGGAWLDVLLVSLGSGGTGTALAVAIHKFLDRHKDKTVSFGPEGEVLSMTGYSADDVITVLDAAEKKRRNEDDDRPCGR